MTAASVVFMSMTVTNGEGPVGRTMPVLGAQLSGWGRHSWRLDPALAADPGSSGGGGG